MPDDRDPDFAPETVNSEQDDADAQAQTVAEDATGRVHSILTPQDSEKLAGSLGAITPDDTQDLVDHLNQMDSSGIIDMSAFRGEDNHDDLEGKYGRDGAPDPEFADDDS